MVLKLNNKEWSSKKEKNNKNITPSVPIMMAPFFVQLD